MCQNCEPFTLKASLSGVEARATYTRRCLDLNACDWGGNGWRGEESINSVSAGIALSHGREGAGMPMSITMPTQVQDGPRFQP